MSSRKQRKPRTRKRIILTSGNGKQKINMQPNLGEADTQNPYFAGLCRWRTTSMIAGHQEKFSKNWHLQGVSFCGIRLFEKTLLPRRDSHDFARTASLHHSFSNHRRPTRRTFETENKNLPCVSLALTEAFLDGSGENSGF